MMNRLCGVRLESSNAKEEEFWASAPLRLHVPAHRQSSSRPAALAAHPGTITREMSEQEWQDSRPSLRLVLLALTEPQTAPEMMII